MTVTTSFDPTAGILTILGDPDPNAIIVTSAGVIQVNGGQGGATIANTNLVRVSGLEGNDTITFDEANGALPGARMFGGSGDILFGKGGADLLIGGAGDDTLTGGDLDDRIFGEAGNDRMIWNPGDNSDLFEGGAGIDTAEINGDGSAETFLVTVSGGRVRFDRTSVPTFILDIGTTEHLVINANGGNDQIIATGNLAPLIGITVHGGAGSDGLTGGNETDFLFGDADDDGLNGGDGNDRLDGGAGADDLHGGAGNDTYVLGSEVSGNDEVIDSSGIDTIISNIDRSLAFSGYGEIENLVLLGGSIGIGNTLANTITSNAATNTLIGGDASDAYFINSPADVVVELGGAIAGTLDHVIFTGLPGQTYLLNANVERLTLGGTAASRGTGNALNNLMTGNAAANTLNGGRGNDTIIGLGGNDSLIGGIGVDRLTGGAGKDSFVLNAPLSIANRDVVTDFNHVADTFRLENNVMKALGRAGRLDSDFFFTGAKAHDADDRVIYDRAHGRVFYDSKGDAAGGVTLLATILNKPALAANDFVVI